MISRHLVLDESHEQDSVINNKKRKSDEESKVI